MNNQWINKNVLFTCNQWFTAPDGKDYKVVYGTLKAILKTDDVFGFSARATAGHVNYIFEVGNMVIAGCQVQYGVLCPTPPDFQTKPNWLAHEGKIIPYDRPNVIYNANSL